MQDWGVAIPSNDVTESAPAPPVTRLFVVEPEEVRPRLRELVEKIEGRRFEVVHEFSLLPAAAAALSECPADLVLIDIGDRARIGLDDLAGVPALPDETPFLVIDRAFDGTTMNRAREVGAQEYLVRSDLTPSSLERALRWIEGRRRDRSAAPKAEVSRLHEELKRVQLQLIEAEKLESIGRLAAGVAHEIKNPLAIISMGIEFLQRRHGEDATTATVLRELADAVSRADEVTRGFLDFSAPHKLDLHADDLNAIIRASLGLVRGEIHEGAHRVELELGNIPPVNVDHAKVVQVFVNLFTNALHAMEGGGTLTVRTRAATAADGDFGERDPAPMVTAEVADTGPGIPPDALERVFEPFYTTKAPGKGTGLGMSVVKSIMNLQRGTVRMTNRPEGGALATLTFPTQQNP